MRITGIYAITDESLVPGRTHVEIVRAALAGGASAIQLRDKRAHDSYLAAVGKEVRRITSEAGALFVVNDRVEVALECGADGLHVGREDVPVEEARRLFPKGILGISVATTEQAARARSAGADYLGVGPVFKTSTKQDSRAPVGVEHIRRMREASSLPIVAIGGINLSNIAEVARAGADAAAVISAIVCAEDMIAATRLLVEAWGAAAGESRRSSRGRFTRLFER